MTSEQRDVCEQLFDKMSDEEKIEFTRNPESRKKLLLTTREEVKSVPKSLFESIGNTPQSVAEGKVKELFEKLTNQGNYTPPGPVGSSFRTIPEREGEPQRSRPVGTGGVLDKINREKETAAA